jgi:hypothetical protein
MDRDTALADQKAGYINAMDPVGNSIFRCSHNPSCCENLNWRVLRLYWSLSLFAS